MVGDGGKVPNRGQKALNLESEGAKAGEANQIKAIFQITKVTRPLMSVSRICDGGMTAHFDKWKAVIKDKDGRVVCVFDRKGGFYVCRMKLKSPFGRHA